MKKNTSELLKKRIFVLVSGLFFLPSLMAKQPCSALEKPKKQLEEIQLQEAIDKLKTCLIKSTTKWNDPGMVVAVVHRGKTVLMHTQGHTDLTKKNPITPTTLFALASLSKTFTATLMGVAGPKFSLDLSDNITKYISQFILANNKDIKIQDLLNHGLPFSSFRFDSLWYTGSTMEQIVPLVRNLKIKDFHGMSYQNFSYAIFEEILKKIQSKSVPCVYEELLFKPIGLAHTILGVPETSPSEDLQPSLWTTFKNIIGIDDDADVPTTSAVAVPHDYDGKCRVRRVGFTPRWNRFLTSAGVMSCGQDLSQWMIFWLNKGKVNGEQIVPLDHILGMTTPNLPKKDQTGYSYQFPPDRMSDVHYSQRGGWYTADYGIEQDHKVSILFHMGGFSGTRSLMFLVPELDLGLVALSNLGGIATSLHPEALSLSFLDAILTELFQEKTEAQQEEKVKNKKIKGEKDWVEAIYNDAKEKHHERDVMFYQQKLLNPSSHDDLKHFVGDYKNNTVGRVRVFLDTKGVLTMAYHDQVVPLVHENANMFSFEASKLSKAYNGLIAPIAMFGVVNNKKALYLSIFSDTENDTLFKIDEID